MLLEIRSREAGRGYPGKALDFEGEVDLSGLTRWNERPFPEPVRLVGKAVDRGNFYEVDYTAEFLYCMPCPRCLQPVRERRVLRFRHTALEQADGGEPEDFLPVRDGILDAEEMALSDILLETEGVTLCSQDCKGLCPVCGGNRNETDCGCDTSLPDPRFGALRQLMEDED
jgi:uncharacterized protein